MRGTLQLLLLPLLLLQSLVLAQLSLLLLLPLPFWVLVPQGREQHAAAEVHTGGQQPQAQGPPCPTQ